MKKKKDTTAKDQTTMTTTEVGVLIEDLRSDFGVFGESLNLLNQKFDGLTVRVDRVETKVDDLGLRVIRLEGKVDRLESATLEILKDTTEIKKSVASHHQRISHLEEITAK